MRTDPAHLAHARQVADAVLYEGYLLYPYRQSSQKNRTRFQFGVLMPPPYGAVDEQEPSASQTECLAEGPDDARLEITVRFLHLQRRTVQRIAPHTRELSDVESLWVDGTEYTCWDEAVEREQSFHATIGELLGVQTELRFRVAEGEEFEGLTDSRGQRVGRLLRRWEQLDGSLTVCAERVAGPYRALRLRVRLANRAAPATQLRRREDGLRYAMIAAHLLIALPGGAFLSQTDPPEWAAAEAARCTNAGTWPVLAGPEGCRDLLLSSPVILYDHPQVAPESAGDLFDATEIDEILTLRTLALTDEEKREVRGTDRRAADLLDRLDTLPPAMLEKMHGAIRYLSPTPATQAPATQAPATQAPATPAPVPADAGVPFWQTPGALPQALGLPSQAPGLPSQAPGLPSQTLGPPSQAPGLPSQTLGPPPQTPWWDPGADASVSPETDHVLIGGVKVARGSKVRMRPGSRRADAQDLFLVGREAVVEAVLHDVDGLVHVAVSPVSDPLADLQRHHGRFLYFAPDELEPVQATPHGGVTLAGPTQ